MVDQVRPDILSRPGQEREYAGWHAGFVQDLGEPERDAGRLLGRLEQHGVAADEWRYDHAARDREREVPRRDDGDDATRAIRVDVGFSGDLDDRHSAAEP